jgi:hypothetical protein
MRALLVARKALQRQRVLGQVPEAARHPPHRRHHRADAAAGQPHLGAAAFGARQHPGHERRPSTPPVHSASVGTASPVACASSEGRSCPAGSVTATASTVATRHRR